MRILIMGLVLGLVGCVEGLKDEPVDVVIERDDLYIVSGQSNALGCDWSYFEGLTGNKVINIARDGNAMDYLISYFDSESVAGTKPKGIILVHGESDSRDGTLPATYIEEAEQYRALVSDAVGFDLSFYISTVGNYDLAPKEATDAIRAAVIEEADKNHLWNIAYNDAVNFGSWGLLVDGVHFTEDGCKVMMEGVSASL